MDAKANMQHQSLVTTTHSQQYLVIDPASTSDGHYHLTDQFAPQFDYTCWPKKKSEDSYLVSSTFEGLAYSFAEFPAVVRNYNDRVFSPFAYGPAPGNSWGPRECHFLTFNIEHACADATQPKHVLACIDGLASFAYPTSLHSDHSHRGANFRVFVALRTAIPVEYYKQVAIRFAHRFSSLDAGVNSSYVLTDQKIAFPSRTSRSGLDGFRVTAQRGRAFDWLPDLLDAQPLTVSPRGAH
jgi:hypothetical protein